MVDQNIITYIQNMDYETMLRLWRTMPPSHEYFTVPEYWAEFEKRRKELHEMTTQGERVAASKRIGLDGTIA